MPNICCRCNTSGRCKNYSCKKSGRECSGCLPYRHGLCTNPKSPHAISSLSLDTTACSSLQSTNDTQSATNPTSFSNFCQAAATVTPAKSSELPTRAADVTIDHAAQPELLSDTIPNDCSAFQLPSFPPAESKSFCWGERDGASVAHSIQQCYDEVVHWRRNVFKVPSSKAFVHKTTCLFQAYASGSALESIALQAAMIMPALLQKPHAKSKSADHSKHLDPPSTALV